MTQTFEPPARTAGAIVSVRDRHAATGDHGEDGAVHAARLVDIGRGELEPVLPVCDALITPARTDDPVTCEICLIRLRPDAFTKAARRVRHLVHGWLHHT